MLRDGFITHSALSCTVLSNHGAQLPALWFVPKIDGASEIITPVPEACTNRFLLVERSTEPKTSLLCLQVMLVKLCLFIFFFLRFLISPLGIILLVCSVRVAAVSFSPFCFALITIIPSQSGSSVCPLCCLCS